MVEKFNEGGFGVGEGLVDIVGEGIISAIGARIGENTVTKVRANSRTEGGEDVGTKGGDDVDSEGLKGEFKKGGDKDSEVALDGHILSGDNLIVEDEIKENEGNVEGNESEYMDSSKLGDYGDSELLDDEIDISYLGIPYCHAVCAMYHDEKNPEAYVSPWYNKEKYVATYSQVLRPVGGEFWLKRDHSIPPPPVKKMPGRPKKNKRKSKDEQNKRASLERTLGEALKCHVLCVNK
ncbi:hypothetical protein GOBAR_DD01038 [Gossypium barbadense]|nr:hypothetical protein GOBAR_DD01038 [Gossypium barbadense]